MQVAGQLAEPFDAEPEDETVEFTAGEDVDLSTLRPGDEYLGPADDSRGTFKLLRQKRGGLIERAGAGRSVEFAAIEGGQDPEREANARRLLDAWRSVIDPGMTVKINELGHAWFTAEGKRVFLADVGSGFAWPTDEDAVTVEQ